MNKFDSSTKLRLLNQAIELAIKARKEGLNEYAECIEKAYGLPKEKAVQQSVDTFSTERRVIKSKPSKILADLSKESRYEILERTLVGLVNKSASRKDGWLTARRLQQSPTAARIGAKSQDCKEVIRSLHSRHPDLYELLEEDNSVWIRRVEVQDVNEPPHRIGGWAIPRAC